MREDSYRPVNMDNEAVVVRHAKLRRASNSSPYKSCCPCCADGVLLVGRDQKTFDLLEYDRCVSCGQLFRYEDIEEMRSRER